MPNKHEPARRFVGGALCDFVGYLDNLKDPIIVGGSYSRKLLIKAFSDWCLNRGVSMKDADGASWLASCKTGALTGEDNASTK